MSRDTRDSTNYIQPNAMGYYAFAIFYSFDMPRIQTTRSCQLLTSLGKN